MPYWRLFYHIAWCAKGRLPLIQDSISASLHEQIAAMVARLGAIVHAIGGIEDHIHLAVSVLSSIALSEFIRQLKGSNSHFVNHELALSGVFAWQSGYGVISLDSKQLDRVAQYVKSPREHHALRTTIPVLERLSEEAEVGKTKPSLGTNR